MTTGTSSSQGAVPREDAAVREAQMVTTQRTGRYQLEELFGLVPEEVDPPGVTRANCCLISGIFLPDLRGNPARELVIFETSWS